MEDIVLCEICKEGVRPKQQHLKCCVCPSNFHRVCTGVSQRDYRTMVKAMETDQYTCQKCSEESMIDLSETADRSQLEMEVQESEPRVTEASDTLSNVTASKQITKTKTTSSTVQNVQSKSADKQASDSVETNVTPLSSASQNNKSTSQDDRSVTTQSGQQVKVAASTREHSVTASKSNVQSQPMSTTSISSISSEASLQSASTKESSFTATVQNFFSRINGLVSRARDIEKDLEHRHKGNSDVSENAKQVSPAENQTNGTPPVESAKPVNDKEVPELKYGCCIKHGTVKKGDESSEVVKYKTTPFNEKITDIIPPCVLVQTHGSTVKYNFKLSKDHAAMLSRSNKIMKRDIQVHVRICLFNVGSSQEENHPEGELLINNHKMSLNPKGLESTTKAEHFDITRFVKTYTDNCIRLTYIASQAYYISFVLIRKTSMDEMLDMIPVYHPQHTEDMVKEKFKGGDDDIATTNLKVSLICPIGKMRLLKPCRSTQCSHLQCFDCKTILSMNEKKTSWKCPVCQKPVEFQDLFIDGLYLKILETVSWDVMEIEFLKDGSWTHKKAGKQAKSSEEADKENICNLLDETIDKLDVIDLTETDDECTPVKKQPLKTNTSLINKVTNRISQKLAVITAPQNQRLGSQGSTCSEGSSRSYSTSSSVSTDSISPSPISTVHNKCLSLINTAYSADNSSYGHHRNNKHNHRRNGPYTNSVRHKNRQNDRFITQRQATIHQYWQNSNYSNNVNYEGNQGNYFYNTGGYYQNNYFGSGHRF